MVSRPTDNSTYDTYLLPASEAEIKQIPQR